MGGTDEADNLVNLTAKEHFIVHKLLVEIYPKEKGLRYAVRRLTYPTSANGTSRKYIVGSREYQRIRESIIVSEETREKISKGNTGKVRTKDVRKRISNSMKGKKNCLGNTLTKEHKENISKGSKRLPSYWRGKNLTESMKNKISNSMKGKKRSRTHCLNLGKVVEQYDLNGGFIKEYKTIQIAAEELGIQKTGISAAVRGRYTQSGGYIWKYKNEKKIG